MRYFHTPVSILCQCVLYPCFYSAVSAAYVRACMEDVQRLKRPSVAGSDGCYGPVHPLQDAAREIHRGRDGATVTCLTPQPQVSLHKDLFLGFV